jgi:hypothetical protein
MAFAVTEGKPRWDFIEAVVHSVISVHPDDDEISLFAYMLKDKPLT